MATEMPDWSREEVRARHAQQQRLCVALETVADALPDAVKPCMLARARALIADYLKRVAPDDLLIDRHGPARARLIMDDLIDERRKDIFIAEEVAEALSAWSCGEANMTPDAMGYLLRGLFDRLRQQMALEANYLVQLAPDKLKSLH